MQLTPTEEDRLRIFTAAELARRSLARGLRLNAPEAVALVCDEMHLAARGGASWAEVRAAGETAVPGDRVLPGVANVIPEIRVEVILEEGSRLIVLRAPFGPPDPDGPGGIRFGEGPVELAPERRRIRLRVRNEGQRPIRVSSHFPFWEINERLVFDRDAARGFRLDLPAGDSIRWEPGETREVELVAFAGPRGPADDLDSRGDPTPADEPDGA
jgi:urease subunit gamma/beta